MKEKLGSALSDLIPQALTYGKMLIIALIILFLGFWLIKKLIRGMKALMEKRNLDPTLTSFSVSVINIALKVLLIISVVSYIGIPMTSFVAILGAASLAVGMALQGTLQNFAGGVMLLLFRPFKVGDFIEVSGKSGTVRQIGVFHTQIATPDNQLVYLPNSHITSAEITNVTGSELRRIELTVQASYDAPPETVKAALVRAAQHPKRVEKEPVFARLSAYGDSAVSYTLRLWTAGSDYWDVYYDVLEAVGREFSQSNIEMTYPHINVHMDS